MRLKSIKLAGFKSFVDPTIVSFPGNLCAIVGPNGCGKSNIIDAVRWVMGESSAKQLRGEALTDVIFNGSNARRPTSIASIELIFDNSDGRIGGEYAAYAEISIRRQVSRDGQSVYFLNTQRCRRRDITDIFLGTGFGPRSYSIIEQGMIGELVEAKPEELRSYLEEAAGISKYKERRRETESRIRRTKDNLDRLNDLRDELQRQIGQLKRQARAAERYQTLKDEERRTMAELLTLRWQSLGTEFEQHDAKVKSWELELERAQAGLRSIESAIEETRARLGEDTQRMSDVQGRYYQLGADIARTEQSIQYHEQRMHQLQSDLDESAQRESRAAEELRADDELIRSVRESLDGLQPRLAEAERMETESSTALVEREAELERWQEHWDAFAHRAAENRREVEVQVARLEHLEQLIARLEDRIGRQDYAAVADDATAEQERDRLQGEQIALDADVRSMDEAHEDVQRELLAGRESVESLEQSLGAARESLTELESSYASLEALQRAALGRDVDGAVRWLDARGLAQASRLGECLTVEPGWEAAAEVVLGPLLQGVVVDSLGSVAQGLAEIPEGALTLLALKQGAPRTSAEPRRLLADVVTSDLDLEPVLNGVQIADALEAALARREALTDGESIVTREGIWIGHDWARVARGDTGTTGLLARAQELESRRAKLEAAREGVVRLQRDLVEERDRLRSLEERRDELRAQLDARQREHADITAQQKILIVRHEESMARQRRAAAERAEIDEQLTTERDHLNQAKAKLASARERASEDGEEEQRLRARRGEIQETVEAAREQLQQRRRVHHDLSLRRQELEAKLSSTRVARDRLVRQQGEFSQARRQLELGIGQAGEPLPELRENLEQYLAQRLEVERMLGELRRGLEEVEASLRAREEKRVGAEARVQDVRQGLEQARLARQEIDTRRSGLAEQVDETPYAMSDLVAGLAEAEDATLATWEEKLEKLGARINRLGAINLAAIDEFKVQSERKEYLDAQNEDLEAALTTLENAIRRIDRETRTRFKETFDLVNNGLKELFPQVFGGGHAYLELTGDDLLSTGVTLMARPPGKRNSSIHLLSGGEKALTALALIFAIFQLNPSPVCMLDEVDAPLDDSNVVRYARLLQEMSREIQFIFVTHNKITMEMAEHLMGVTMQEPGVSRLVSVDVEEAAALAAV
jgi:chromosome segregation protein